MTTRTHPDDPNVVEMRVDSINQMNIDMTHPCQGCPHFITRDGEDCPFDDRTGAYAPEYVCGKGMHWFGHHIYIANKLEGSK